MEATVSTIVCLGMVRILFSRSVKVAKGYQQKVAASILKITLGKSCVLLNSPKLFISSVVFAAHPYCAAAQSCTANDAKAPALPLFAEWVYNVEKHV